MIQPKNRQKFASYFTAVGYLESLGNIAGGYQKTNLTAHPQPEMFLERMQDFLDRLGNPEKGFKYIHITGTAGKGSVSALVHAALVRAGKNSGLFTSPFTVSTIEKIHVGDKYIDPLVFVELTDFIKPHIDRAIESDRHGTPSYFEMMLAIALLYFKREKCEYVVLEVGLGGRYDATNIIQKPLVTAITNIGLDHTNILGPRRTDIATDKAGIIKKGSSFFTTEQDPRILRIFKKACSEVGAMYQAVPVKGLDYQASNRALAFSICRHLGIVEHPNEMPTDSFLPARFEIIARKPLVIIDGAHNPSKMDSTVYRLGQLAYNRLLVVFAVSADKDWKTMLKKIAPQASIIHVTRFNVSGRSALNPGLLAREARKYARRPRAVNVFSDPFQAFAAAKKEMKAGDALLVTGSFYLAGDIRGLYCPEERILQHRSSRIA
jgi:dihydrofolate synthase/folylpolyglutamate synthase